MIEKSNKAGRPEYRALIHHPDPAEPDRLCQMHDPGPPAKTRKLARMMLMQTINPRHLKGQLFLPGTIDVK